MMMGALAPDAPLWHALPPQACSLAPLTKRQQNQPFMVNALLSVVVYFL
jgi:hypothetical protein